MSRSASAANPSKHTSGRPARHPAPASDMPFPEPVEVIDTDAAALQDPGQVFLKHVIDAIVQKNHSLAIERVQNRLKDLPKNVATLNLLAALHIRAHEEEKAEKSLLQALRLAPQDSKVINNLACVHLLRDAPRSAETLLMGELRHSQPGFAEFYYNLALTQFLQGHLDDAWQSLLTCHTLGQMAAAFILMARICLAKGDVKGAEQILLDAAGKFPNDPQIKYFLAGCCMMQDKWQEGLAFAMIALRAQPQNRHFALLYGQILRYINFTTFSPEHLETIYLALNNPGVNTTNLSQAWLSLFVQLPVWRDLCQQAGNITPAIAAKAIPDLKAAKILAHPFILSGLQRTFIRDAVPEQVLIALRAAYLDQIVTETTALDAQDLAFLAALACQCFYNEYVYFVTDAEQASLDLLCTRLQNSTAPDQTTLLILCCYAPLHQTITSDQIRDLTNAPLFIQIIREQIQNRDVELAIMQDLKALPRLTAINDEISRAVEQMYIENPYPAWLQANYGGDQRFLRLSEKVQDRVQCLIAGCGTGHHAVNTALSNQNLQVTAIDLSRRSLAYAMRKTQEMGLTNIDYAQADILELGSIGRTFDYIECSGVLHHLADPIKGLEILLGLLRPQGRIRLGLYSERARESMVAGREAVAKRGYPSTLDGIRRFRHDVITANNPSDPLTGLMKNGDFYTTSTCRDLVFHVQESRYTLPELAQILDSHDLDFLDLQIDAPRKAAFRKLHPHPEALRDLSLWHAFEEKHPDTFSNMYQFWAQKRG